MTEESGYGKKRFQVNLAVYLIIEKDGKVLMLRRVNTGYQDGKYGLPSGHVEEEEMPFESVKREAKEEVGVKIESPEFSNIVYNTKGGYANYICLFFKTSKWSGEIKNCEEEKCDDIGWFEKNNLPTNTVPEVKVGIENYKNNIRYSEI